MDCSRQRAVRPAVRPDWEARSWSRRRSALHRSLRPLRCAAMAIDRRGWSRNGWRRRDRRGVRGHIGRRNLLERRHSRPRNVAADEGRDRPHQDGHSDNDGGENDHALQDRGVKPDILVVVIVVLAHHIRPRFSQRMGWSTTLAACLSGSFAIPRRKRDCASRGVYAAAFFNFSATFAAKYVSTPSAPARLKAIRLSIIALSPSSQPFPAAAMIIAYSPET